MFVSVISLGEIAAGMRHNATARAFARRFGRTINVFPELALTAADIDRELIAVGMRLGENDQLAGWPPPLLRGPDGLE